MASYRNFSRENRRQKDIETNKYSDINNEPRTTLAEQEVFSFSKNKEKWRELCSYWRAYPDKFIDKIRDPNSKIKLYFYQRIYLRIIFRYRKVFLTATRGTSKSYLINLAFILLCIMYPGIKLFTCARIKEQAAKISQDCINDILDHYPVIRNEIKQFAENKDYTKLVFHNGSKYDVVQMQDSTRGGRRHGGCVEEIGSEKFDGDILHSVVIPLMANNRLAKNGRVDPNEIHKREIYVTTASKQQQFAYQKLQEVYQEMVHGEKSFAVGNSYELPCMYNQLDIDFVESLRESPTFAIADFMREYESLYTGSSNDALVAEDKLQKSRTVGVAEFEHCGEKNVEYCLAYDVSRNEGDQNALSCLAVIKLTPKDNGDYVKELVNIFSREGEHSAMQAKFLKEKVREFKPRILIVDANGLGVSVVDQLVLDLGDGNPPYAVVNDSDYDRYEQPDSIPILYALKAQHKETKNSDMINHFMQVFAKIDIGLLKVAHEGLKDVEKKIRRKLKDSEEISQYEIPYLLTSNLCEEISNLKYKQNGNETQVERVSRSIPKDKFSALMYGLYWIYLQEKKNKESVKKRKTNWFDYIKY